MVNGENKGRPYLSVRGLRGWSFGAVGSNVNQVFTSPSHQTLQWEPRNRLCVEDVYASIAAASRENKRHLLNRTNLRARGGGGGGGGGIPYEMDGDARRLA